MKIYPLTVQNIMLNGKLPKKYIRKLFSARFEFQMHFEFSTRDISMQRCSVERNEKGGMGGNFQSLHFSTRCTWALKNTRLIPMKLCKSLTLILKSGEPEREGKKNLKRQRNRESMNKNLFRDIMYMSIHMVFSLHATRSESGEKNIVRSSSCNAKVVGWFAWRTNARAKTTSSAATKGVWWERMKRKKQAKQAYKIGGYDEIGFAGLLRACVCVLQIKSYIMKIPLTHHMQTHSHTMRTFMPIIQSVNWQI